MKRFIEITSDANPLHTDDQFSAKTQFGRRVVHGMLAASLFSTMVGMLLPGTGAIYRSQTIRSCFRSTPATLSQDISWSALSTAPATA